MVYFLFPAFSELFAPISLCCEFEILTACNPSKEVYLSYIPKINLQTNTTLYGFTKNSVLSYFFNICAFHFDIFLQIVFALFFQVLIGVLVFPGDLTKIQVEIQLSRCSKIMSIAIF